MYHVTGKRVRDTNYFKVAVEISNNRNYSSKAIVSNIELSIVAGIWIIINPLANLNKLPLIVWHGFGTPASEEALAKTLLKEVAWKDYLELPLFGHLMNGSIFELKYH